MGTQMAEGPNMAADDSSVELRGTCPRDIVDVLDAVSQSKRVTRMELVNTILRSWAVAKLHEAQTVARVTRNTTLIRDRDDV